MSTMGRAETIVSAVSDIVTPFTCNGMKRFSIRVQRLDSD
jgi:hypothetical protein